MHPILTKIQKQFKKLYYFESPDKNVLKVSDDRDSLPFCIIVIENSLPVVSFTLDFADALKIADFTVGLMHVSPISLAESFYISKGGEIYWGQAGCERFEFDVCVDLNELEPINTQMN